MKKVVLMLSAALLTSVFISCKEQTTTTEVNENEVPEATVINDEIAMADVADVTEAEFLYVLAPSGLSLREYGNLHSQKLAKMPYGSRVKVVKKEENQTMNVGGIPGGMDEVEFNHKSGFAFNGYLSKYFPPERDISAKGYADELQRFFPEVVYESSTGGTASNPSNTETITLPDSEWHVGFYTAQRLFDFPKEFEFPKAKGPNKKVLNDGKPKKGVWVSQLEITRNDNELQGISYLYKSEKFDSTVTITKVDDAMVISRTETIK